MEEDTLEVAIEYAEDLVDLFGPHVMTDGFWIAFRQIVEETAMAPVKVAVN